MVGTLSPPMPSENVYNKLVVHERLKAEKGTLKSIEHVQSNYTVEMTTFHL